MKFFIGSFGDSEQAVSDDASRLKRAIEAGAARPKTGEAPITSG